MNWSALPPLASLRAFAVFIDKGSVLAASDAIGVSHPAVSQHLRNLETHLGLKLLDRDGRALRLTAEGEQLARACEAGFGTLIRTLEEITGAENARPLQISTTPSFAAAWLMPRLSGFRSRFPDIDLMISPSSALVKLEPGGFDLAIRYGIGDWPGLASHMLLRAPTVLVAAPHLVADLPDKRPEAYMDLPWLEELGGSDAQNWMRKNGIEDKRPGRSLQVPGNLLLDGARDGQGVAVTARCFVEADLAAGRLVLLDQSEQEGTGYHVVTREGVLRPAIKVFVKWVLSEAARENHHAAPSD